MTNLQIEKWIKSIIEDTLFAHKGETVDIAEIKAEADIKIGLQKDFRIPGFSVKPKYHDREGGSYLTLCGRLLAEEWCSFDFSNSNRDVDRYEESLKDQGLMVLRWGDPSYLYLGGFPVNGDLPLEQKALVRDLLNWWAEQLTQLHNQKVIASRKEFGRAVNAQFRTADIDPQYWWGMKWKRETTPEEFISLVRNGSINWRLAATAKGWRLIRLAGAGKIQSSVPRIKDIARAVCKARGEKPASPAEIKQFLRTGVDIPQTAPGMWSF